MSRHGLDVRSGAAVHASRGAGSRCGVNATGSRAEQEQRRGSEEEGGVCRGGSNGRELGGGAAAM